MLSLIRKGRLEWRIQYERQGKILNTVLTGSLTKPQTNISLADEAKVQGVESFNMAVPMTCKCHFVAVI